MALDPTTGQPTSYQIQISEQQRKLLLRGMRLLIGAGSRYLAETNELGEDAVDEAMLLGSMLVSIRSDEILNEGIMHCFNL